MADPNATFVDPSAAPTSFVDTGDNAWQLTTATFVGMQTMVGLVMLYGGVVKKKWAVNSAFMVMYSYAAIMIVWVLCGYRFSFGQYMLPFWGKPGTALGAGFLTIQANLYEAELAPNYVSADPAFFQPLVGTSCLSC